MILASKNVDTLNTPPILMFQITFLSRLNPSDGEVDQLRKEIDEDESGDIDFEEFLELMNSTTLR